MNNNLGILLVVIIIGLIASIIYIYSDKYKTIEKLKSCNRKLDDKILEFDKLQKTCNSNNNNNNNSNIAIDNTNNNNYSEFKEKAINNYNDKLKNNNLTLNGYKYIGCYSNKDDYKNKSETKMNFTKCINDSNLNNINIIGFSSPNIKDYELSLENNKLSILPSGECYKIDNENQIDKTKKSDECYISFTRKMDDMYKINNNQIDKNQAFYNNINISDFPIGNNNSIAVYKK